MVMSEKKIEVCEGYWVQRCQQIVYVIKETSPLVARKNYPWIDRTGRTYANDGRFNSIGESPHDLVHYIGMAFFVTPVSQ